MKTHTAAEQLNWS